MPNILEQSKQIIQDHLSKYTKQELIELMLDDQYA